MNFVLFALTHNNASYHADNSWYSLVKATGTDHCNHWLSLSLSFFFFFFYVFCFWPTFGKLPKLKFCLPQYFGITIRIRPGSLDFLITVFTPLDSWTFLEKNSKKYEKSQKVYRGLRMPQNAFLKEWKNSPPHKPIHSLIPPFRINAIS